MFFVCPSEGTVATIETCGRFSHFAHPGLNCVHCYIGQGVGGAMSLRVQQLDVRCETKSKDNVFLTLTISVQYQVQRESLYDAFYRLTDSRGQISSYVFDVVRATVPKMLLDEVFLEKEQIALDIKSELAKCMSGYGYTIIQALVTDIDPDVKVKAAMNDINAAQRMRMAAVERAEAEKIQIIKAAEADAESKYLAGTGIARQRQAVINGLRESVKHFSEGVQDITSKDVLQLMMMTQYFDTMRDIGGKGTNTLFVNPSPGGVGDIAAQMRAAFMESQTMTR